VVKPIVLANNSLLFIWVVDFTYGTSQGELPNIECAVCGIEDDIKIVHGKNRRLPRRRVEKTRLTIESKRKHRYTLSKMDFAASAR
jgi:KaiC/GvpD/RAD55 family RecA-like ATPase